VVYSFETRVLECEDFQNISEKLEVKLCDLLGGKHEKNAHDRKVMASTRKLRVFGGRYIKINRCGEIRPTLFPRGS